MRLPQGVLQSVTANQCHDVSSLTLQLPKSAALHALGLSGEHHVPRQIGIVTLSVDWLQVLVSALCHSLGGNRQPSLPFNVQGATPCGGWC